MERAQQWIVLTVLGCLAIVAAGWFLLVSPTRAAAQDLRAETLNQLTTNAALAQQLTVLEERAEAVPAQRSILADIARRLPGGPDTASLLRALDTAATDAGVALLAVTPAQVVAFSDATGPAPADGAPVAPEAAPGPVLGTLPLTVRVTGAYAEVAQFVAELESLPRAVRVTDLAVEPGANPLEPDSVVQVEDGRNLVATLAVQAYLVLPTVTPTPTPAPGGTG